MATPFVVVGFPRRHGLAGGIRLDYRAVATKNELPSFGQLDLAVLEVAASASLR